jgi:hypothetical protein
MKYLLYILTILLSINCLSQDTRLFETSWYLQNIVVQNNDNEPPSIATLFINEGSPNDNLTLAMCSDFLTNFITFNNINSSFLFVSGDWGNGASDCTNDIFESYKNLYYTFYLNNDTSPFTYEVTEDEDNLSLIITSTNGDQAFYGDELLSINNLNDSSFSIFPNPTQDLLNIDIGNSRNIIIEYRIVDISGQTLKDFNFENLNNHKIDVSNLKSGTYFIILLDSKGNKTIKQFVKE